MPLRYSIPRVEDEATDRAIQALSKMVSDSLIGSGVLLEDVKAESDSVLRVHHGLGRKVKGARIVSADRGSFSAVVVGAGLDYADLSVTSEWEFLERKDFNKDGDTFDFSTKLDGDEDVEYRIDSFVLTGSTRNRILLRVNGGSSTSLTNCHSNQFWIGSSNVTGTGFTLSYDRTTGDTEHYGETHLYAKTGKPRMMRSVVATNDGTGAVNTDLYLAGGKWDDTTTKITSLGVFVGTANNMLAGTNFTLYRRPRIAGRTMNIWIF